MSFPGFHRGRGRRAGRDPLPDALAAFGDTPVSPDFSGSILDRVGEQRPFFETRTQAAVRWSKLVAGSIATGLAVLAGTAVWFAPEIFPWQREPRTITAVVHSAVGDAKAGMNRLDALRRSVESLAARDTATTPRTGWVDSRVATPLARVTGVVRPEAGAIGMFPIRALWGSSGEPRQVASAKPDAAQHASELPASWMESGAGSDMAAPAPVGFDGPGVTPQ